MIKRTSLQKFSLVIFLASLVIILGEACSESESATDLPAAQSVQTGTDTSGLDKAGYSPAMESDFTENEFPPAEPADSDPKDILEEPTVVSLTMCSKVVDRNPADNLDSFDISAGKVFTHTAVASVKPDTIYHVYKFEGTEIARIPLYVGISPRWRTWSSKWLTTGWIGNWTVEIQSAAGRVLAEKSFTVKTTPEKDKGLSTSGDGVASSN